MHAFAQRNNIRVQFLNLYLFYSFALKCFRQWNASSMMIKDDDSSKNPRKNGNGQLTDQHEEQNVSPVVRRV